MVLKKLPNGDKKQLNLHLDKELVQKIRARAAELNMSGTYYISAMAYIEIEARLIDLLGDPFEQEELPKAADIKNEIARLQAELAKVEAPDQPKPANTTPIKPPRMLSRQDLLAAEARGESAKAISFTPSMLETRQRLIQGAQEDLKESKFRKTIIEGVEIKDDE